MTGAKNITVDSANAALTDIAQNFYRYASKHNSNDCTNAGVFSKCLGKSLGKYEHTIRSVRDFSAGTFFTQTDYYKRKYEDDEKLRDGAINFIIKLYRWLITENPDYDFFADSPNMSQDMMMNTNMRRAVRDNYYFAPFNPMNIPYGHERVCFIIKNMDALSTIYTNDTHIFADMSGLRSAFYRDLLVEYFVVYGSTHVVTVNIIQTVVSVMEDVYKAKQLENYPNPSLNKLSVEEAVFIRRLVSDNESISLRTRNGWLNRIKDFLRYCVRQKHIEVQNPFFDYFGIIAQPAQVNAESIPEEELILLDRWFSEHSREIRNRQTRVIMHLLLQTEFRINQICHLTTDCIHPTVNPDQYEIVTNSKSSHGDTERYVITTRTYNLLMDMIDDTEELRRTCPVESMRKYIFITPKGTNGKGVMVFNHTVFIQHMEKACAELGLKKYTASAFRNTHMTLAMESIIRNNKSDAEMSVLSHHKSISTTTNHYIDKKLDEMLEATHGIIIGDIKLDTDDKVVEELPEEYAGEDSEVQHGCGSCSSDTCVLTGNLPCLTCKHFRTTPKHEIYFRKAIENIDRMIEHTENRHEVEGLRTIKALHVLYLKSILKYKEVRD